jgi:polyvinyl alcohol dehydrogenase (cytochrome)
VRVRQWPGEFDLDRYNVPFLTQRWVVNTTGTVVAAPAIVARDLYVPDNGGALYRIDALTDNVVWQIRIGDYSDSDTSCSRTTPAISANILVIGDRRSAIVFAIDRFSGGLIWKRQLDTMPGAIITGKHGGHSNHVCFSVSPKPGITRSQVAAPDLATGQLIWQFRTVAEGYTGDAGWGSTPAADPQRCSLYVTVGNNHSVPGSVATCEVNAPTVEAKDACALPDDHFDTNSHRAASDMKGKIYAFGLPGRS